MMRYGMVVDTSRCIGCHTCAVACRNSNNVPNSIWWNRVLTVGGDWIDTAAGQFPNNEISFLTLACQHCGDPACTKVCPVGATYKDEGTGIVHQDYDKCIGCRMCMAACPYTGVRSFNWEEPAYSVDFPVGDADARPHQKHVVEKCTMCDQKVTRGEKPACVAVCPARARFWGDFDDPDSEVSQLVRTREHMRILPEMGTDPSVYYLV
ncbi:4Fe-4S dicluster domain-containing protein [Rubneribacter sp.]